MGFVGSVGSVGSVGMVWGNFELPGAAAGGAAECDGWRRRWESVVAAAIEGQGGSQKATVAADPTFALPVRLLPPWRLPRRLLPHQHRVALHSQRVDSLYRPPAMTRNATRLSRSRTPPLAIPRLAAPCALSSDGRHEVKPSFGAPSQAAHRAAALVARLSHLTAAYFTVAPFVGDVRPAQNLPLFTTCRGAQSAEIRFPSHC